MTKNVDSEASFTLTVERLLQKLQLPDTCKFCWSGLECMRNIKIQLLYLALENAKESYGRDSNGNREK